MEQQEEVSFADLMASTVHDMKNSLNVQTDMLEHIAARLRQQGDGETASSLGTVIYQANRMNTDLIQMLSLYKLGNSIYPLDIAEHSVSELLDELLLQSGSVMELKGLSVAVDCERDCYWYFDRDLVMGILLNALNNAYNYTKDRIRLGARIENGSLELRVEDNGPGYPPGMLIDGASSEKRGVSFTSGSTGLGFYFSSRVAQLHKNGDRHGYLAIENGGQLGGGCFVVRLP